MSAPPEDHTSETESVTVPDTAHNDGVTTAGESWEDELLRLTREVHSAITGLYAAVQDPAVQGMLSKLKDSPILKAFGL